VLTRRDFKIFRFLHTARLATSAELFVALRSEFKSAKLITRRLTPLFHHGFLDRPASRQLLRRAGQRVTPIVYSLGKVGREALFGRDWAKRRAAIRAGEVYTAEHELLVARIHGAFFAACETFVGGTRVSLDSWETGDAALARDVREEHGRMHVEVLARPDARLILFDASDQSEVWLHIEADRGTIPGQPRAPDHRARDHYLIDRYRGYLEWNRRRCYEQIGAAGVRVATITTTRGRLDALRALAREVNDGANGNLFWFAALPDFEQDPAQLFAPIWRTVENDDPHELLE
jgi:hypothetical protein